MKTHATPLQKHPDPVLLERMTRIQLACILATGVLAAVNLLGWLAPIIDPFLFRGWMLMKANTALMLLLSATSLVFIRSGQPLSSIRFGRSLSALVCVVGVTILLEYSLHVSLGIDTILAQDAGAAHPGRMAPQTAGCFVFFGILTAFFETRRRPATLLVDLCGFLLATLVLLIMCGYCYGALRLFGISQGALTAPQTLIALTLLTFVVLGRRAEYGVMSLLLGVGAGSRLARVATPFVLLMPFLLEALRGCILQNEWADPNYSTAFETALMAVMGFGVVLTLAWRINGLEADIRDLSLRDDLTKLYNRRGFFMFAEKTLLIARRTDRTFWILYIDLDNLKGVNDTFGHDVGSAFICEMAAMLTSSFRDTDVIARIGGDEFVVAGTSHESGALTAAKRLSEAAAARNYQNAHSYPFAFSVGYAKATKGLGDTVEALLQKADKEMYLDKHRKKSSVTQSSR